jgi:hypothetical protein
VLGCEIRFAFDLPAWPGKLRREIKRKMPRLLASTEKKAA